MEKFRLEIALGNEAMQNPADVGHALDKVATELIERRFAEHGPIRDENGSTVGRWEFVRVEEG